MYLLLLLLLLPFQGRAELQVSIFNNTAFGSASLLSNTTVANVDSLSSVQCNQSSVFLGSIPKDAFPAAGEGVRFGAEVDADATLRVWVAEFLVLESTAGVGVDNSPAPPNSNRIVQSTLSLPPSITQQSAAVLFRVQYSRTCRRHSSSDGFLSMTWNLPSNGTIIPATAFSAALTGAQVERESMRRRLYEPTVPWQTYVHSSMAAHTLQPTGLVLRFGILDMSDNAVLGGKGGHIMPWNRFLPAHVLPGRHSLNGSDYTNFVVQSWSKSSRAAAGAEASSAVGVGSNNAAVVRRDARFVIETTTVTESEGEHCNSTATNARCDLLFSASCTGVDCSQMALWVSGSFSWDRAGDVVAKQNNSIAFEPAGFDEVTVHPASGSTIAPGKPPPGAGEGNKPVIMISFFPETKPNNNTDNNTDFEDDGEAPTASGGGAAVLVASASTGHARSAAEISAAITKARARADVLPAHLSHVAALALPLFDVLAWNTLFTNALHVYTPVSRNWGFSGADLDDSATTFVWDVFFAAVMLGLAGPEYARPRDIAYANVITTVFSRTITGMVPNYRTGASQLEATYDRTEPMVGAWSLQILSDVYKEDCTWVIELLFPALLGWNDWVHRRRSAEGALGVGLPGGETALVSLGSDATTPAGLNTPHTLAASRYESGLDNSPQYDGNDAAGNEQFGSGPVRFNATTAHMKLYDVAFTVYHALDSRALVALSTAAQASPSDVATLAERGAATETALHRDMFDASSSQYANRLYNGTFYKRWAPTIFSPMLLGNSTPAERIPGMTAMMENTGTFCVSTSAEKMQPKLTFLWRMQADNSGYMMPKQSITCASQRCLQQTVLNVAGFSGIEAIADAAKSASATLPLNVYYANGDRALATLPPGPGYTLENASAAPEAWCASAMSSVFNQPMVLWYNTAANDHRTCGGAQGCTEFNMTKAGYTKVDGFSPMCYARSSKNVADMPCRYGMPSIGRNDVDSAGLSTFWEQTYWRGRIWAPQYYLVYAGLKAQEHVPAAKKKKAELADQAKRLFTQQYELFGQVNENTNGVLGVGSDNVRADSYYHWGALHALVAIAETGAYPSDML